VRRRRMRTGASPVPNMPAEPGIFQPYLMVAQEVFAVAGW
jgi:hypothetical protein